VFLKNKKIFDLSLLLFVLSVDDNLLYVDDDVKVKKKLHFHVVDG